MALVAVALLCGGGGAFFALLFGRSFARALPVYVLGSAALLYLCALAGLLPLGFWLVLGLAAAGLVWALLHCVRQKSAAWLRQTYLVFPVFACLFFLLLVWCINPLRNFTASDEVNFWGPFVQETLRLESLHTSALSTVGFHQEYPPGMSLLQYLWCKLAGGYSEASMYRATQFFTLVLLLPAFERLQNRPLRDKFCLLALAVVFTLPAADSLYQYVHLDVTLGVCIGATLALMREDERPSAYSIMALALAAFFTCLVKQMGAFVLILACLLALVWFIATAATAEATDGRHRLRARLATARPQLAGTGIRLGVVALACLLALLSWNWHLAAAGVEAGQFSLGSISPGALLAIASGQGGADKLFVLMLFLKATLERGVFTTAIGTFSHLQLIFLFSAVALWLWWRSRGGPGARWRLAFAITVPAGAVVYSLVMLVLYWFTFSPEDALNLAAYERYMGTYWVGVAAAMLLAGPPAGQAALAAKGGGADKKTAKPAGGLALCTLVLLAVAVPGASWYEAFVPHTRTNSHFAPHAAVAARLEEAVDTASDKVYIVDQTTETPGYLTIGFRYYGNPLRTNQGGTNVGTTGGIDSSAWADTLANEGYTLVYIYQLAGTRADAFNTLFGTGGPAEGGLYRVQQSGGTLALALVDTIE